MAESGAEQSFAARGDSAKDKYTVQGRAEHGRALKAVTNHRDEGSIETEGLVHGKLSMSGINESWAPY